MNRYNWKGYDFIGTVPEFAEKFGYCKTPTFVNAVNVFHGTNTTAWTQWSKEPMRKNANVRSEPTASIWMKTCPKATSLRKKNTWRQTSL